MARESVRDLVRNLTNLALAITEDRVDKSPEEVEVEEEEVGSEQEEEERTEKRRLVVSTSEGVRETPEGGR